MLIKQSQLFDLDLKAKRLKTSQL